MVEKFDKSLAVQHYVEANGNRMDRLHEYCGKVDYDGDIFELATEIEELQGAIWGRVIRTSGRTGLTARSLERIVRQFVEKHVAWIDDTGFHGLMTWVRAMAVSAEIVPEWRGLENPDPASVD